MSKKEASEVTITEGLSIIVRSSLIIPPNHSTYITFMAGTALDIGGEMAMTPQNNKPEYTAFTSSDLRAIADSLDRATESLNS